MLVPFVRQVPETDGVGPGVRLGMAFGRVTNSGPQFEEGEWTRPSSIGLRAMYTLWQDHQGVIIEGFEFVWGSRKGNWLGMALPLTGRE